MNNQAEMLDVEENTRSIGDYINVIRRRKRVLAITAGTVMTIIILAAFLWPKTYRSQAIILIEQQDIPTDLVQTTITSYAQQRIEEIKQRIMTIGNIIGIVEEFELYTERELERITRTEIAEDFRSAVSIKPISAEVVDPRSGRPSLAIIAFSLSFDGENPSKVQKITNEITTLYLDENLKDRTAQTKSTSDFLTAESDVLSGQLEDLDEKIAFFKEKNKGALPEQNQFNLSVVDRTELQINDLDFQIKELQKRKIQLEGDLTQISPSAPTMLSNGQMVLGKADRLKALQSQIRQYESIYHPQHPSLQRIRREINALLDGSDGLGDQHKEMVEQLSQERDILATLEGKYTADHSKILQSKRVIDGLELSLADSVQMDAEVTPDNPAYLVLRTRLNATNEDIRNNSEKIKVLRVKIERYEGYLSRAPQIEKEYQYLLRDYHNTRIKYQEIRAKTMSADLAQNLESERKGERFTLIQPPELPIDPVSPNRTAMVFLAVILGLGVGLGVVIMLEAMSAAVFGAAEVTALTGIAPLAIIGYMETQEEEGHHNRKRILIVLGLICIGLLAMLLFHLFVKPLDVTWYILLRKFGI
jgi:succinoglycan biosynthesis transport protein ExoP